MKFFLKQQMFLSILILLGLAVFNCVSFNKDYPEKKSFLLEIHSNPTTSQLKSRLLSSEYVVKLRKLNVSNKFSDRSFVYRRSDTKYESDFYNELLISPQQNISEELIRYLDSSNAFKSATDMSSRIEATHFIEVDVIQLYGDFRVSDQPQSVLELQLRVFDDRNAEYRPVWRKNYFRSITMKNESPEALVIGWNTALSEISKEFISESTQWK